MASWTTPPKSPCRRITCSCWATIATTSADSRVPVTEGGVGLLPTANLVGRVETVLGSWDIGLKNQPISTWLSGLRTSRFLTSVN